MIHSIARRDVPDPCTEEAHEQGCTCYVPTATAYDFDPPEPKIDRYCPLHGWAPDPDDERDRRRDDALCERNRPS